MEIFQCPLGKKIHLPVMKKKNWQPSNNLHHDRNRVCRSCSYRHDERIPSPQGSSLNRAPDRVCLSIPPRPEDWQNPHRVVAVACPYGDRDQEQILRIPLSTTARPRFLYAHLSHSPHQVAGSRDIVPFRPAR